MNQLIGSKQDETKAARNPLSQMAKGGATLTLCRTCGKKGDHWTARCPYKDLTQPNESNTNNPLAETNAAEVARKGAYVPPSKRGGASASSAERSGADIKRRNDENSVRVSNLSEDTRDADLLELFQPFGPVSRAHVVFDRSTGASRGFGYVNFVNREHGERAISKLDGYGYDNLILRVEWSVRS